MSPPGTILVAVVRRWQALSLTSRILAGLGLLALWAIAWAVVGVMPPSFVNLYIPANPFYSLANNVVPAVTLFSAAVGVALIGVQIKASFPAPLDALMRALSRVTHFIVELTPLGVVPIAAVAAGTLTRDALLRLEVYLVTFAVAGVLMGVALPTP